ncbi:MAG: response regulator, partial [Gemmataceae bacterium]
GVWVERGVDRGRCLNFKLFLDIPDSSEPPRTLQPSPDMLGMRVLVVEDNATQGSILEETLLTWRMQPTILHDASAALQEIQDAEKDGDPYSVVLIDSRMPSPGGYALAESIQKRAYGLNGIVMLATPAESALHAEKHRQLGLPSCVLKPIKQSELLHTLLAISTKSQAISAPPVRSKNQADYPELPPLQILLAEDTQVNQTLAVRILEKAGHSVHVASNGLLVLEYLQNKTCDLILMDLQMPELGGLETTIRIREQEKQTGKHLPIIALTAHAMKGDRERCLEAGMDGYVSKPIRTRELFQVMEQVLRNFAVHLFDGDAPRLETPEQSSPSSLDIAHSEPFNRSQALDHCGGDPQLLQELIDMFLLEIDGWLSHLSSALASGNTKEVTRMAHTIKGSVGTFAAARCYQLSLDMEILGKTNRLPEAPLLRDQLQEELAKLKLALREYHPSS